MTPGMAPSQAYPALRALGFDGVEHAQPYDHSVHEIAALLDENDLQMAALFLPFELGEGQTGIACDPRRVDEFEAGVAKAITYAQATKCPLLGVLPGRIPANADPEASKRTLIRNLAFAAEAAGRSGKRIFIEPIATRRMSDFAVHTLEQGQQLIDATHRAELCLCFDTLHVSMEEGSVLRDLERYWDRIGYIQIANAPSRRGPYDGELDLPAIVRAIRARHWDGWLCLEYTPQALTPTLVTQWVRDAWT
jgi:hydroxypyruvate isomerase